MILVDSGAWFSLFEQHDPNHSVATRWFNRNHLPLIVTDYIVDETLTLLRARGTRGNDITVGEQFFRGDLAEIVYVTEDDIRNAWNTFHRFDDKGWSFTDCVSRVVMERLGITTAASFDHHFYQFGSIQVVP